ncbi:MAG: fatty acid desaturase [Actinomycetota bacterium]|nr:fatty acid desaturase [Actinomycetota bacterium]
MTRDALAPYARPHVGRSVLDLATSVVPYVALTVLGYVLFDVAGVWAALAVAPLAGGFLLRTYIMFHDCAHGSFLPSKRGNVWLGRFLGIVVWTPYAKWKHDHAVHHATSGDLDRRGTGDVTTWTVAEYKGKSWKGRLGYRLFRNPLVMFGLGPIWGLMIQPRRTGKNDRPRLRNSVHLTNAALLVVVGAILWLVGWQAWLAVQFPAMFLAAAAGVWLFYVQHQFEDAYWENADSWSYADAALQGSSHLDLPQPLQWFSGNIGLHHVHHLSARVPNYHLQAAHDNVEVFRDVPRLSMWEGVKAARLKLWDEDARRLVTWAEVRPGVAPRAHASQQSA